VRPWSYREEKCLLALRRRLWPPRCPVPVVADAMPVVPEPVEYMIVSAPRLARGAFLFDELSALEVWITGMPANDPKRAIKSGARF